MNNSHCGFDGLSDNEKARILVLHEDGEISNYAARVILGDEGFTEAQELADATEDILSQDTERYTRDGEEKQ